MEDVPCCAGKSAAPEESFLTSNAYSRGMPGSSESIKFGQAWSRQADRPVVPNSDRLFQNDVLDMIKTAVADELVQFRAAAFENWQTLQQDLLEKQRDALKEHLGKLNVSADSVTPTPLKPTSEDKLREAPVSSGSSDSMADRKTMMAHDQCKMLREIFTLDEVDQVAQAKVKAGGNLGALRNDAETAIDAAIGIVITFNAFYIGFSMDYSDTYVKLCLFIEIIFASIFTLEIGAKIFMKGLCGHFGNDTTSNLFDLFLVTIDVAQITLTLAVGSGGGLSSAAKFLRMLKIAKLARLTKLLKSPVFIDLVAMVRGLMGGITTLGWAILLFMVIVYVMSLVFREAFGREEEAEGVYDYFMNVPRSMYTVFRCSLGDCSADGGTPIFEHVLRYYGSFAGVLLCMYWFFVTVGLFNVISAIFVEATMAAGAAIDLSKRNARLADKTLWATRISTIIRGLIDCSPEHQVNGKMSAEVGEINEFEIPCSCLDDAVCDPEVAQALADLDLNPDDNAQLSDILDPDNGGTISARDLIDGLRRLRGVPRRSDIVAVNLMIRSIQAQVNEIIEKVNVIYEIASTS